MAGLLEKAVISPILIGRAEQLAALGQRLQLARARQGQVVLISGEAGVGKTRLVAEIKAQSNSLGFAGLQGNCFEPDQNLPYGPLVDLLRAFLAQQPDESIAQMLGPQASELAVILPELASLPTSSALPPPISDRYRLFHAVEQVFFRLAARAPLLVVVEDVHWSDDASLDLLLHLAQRLLAQPLVLLLTYRSEDAGAPLARFLLALNRARLAHELALAPLTPAEMDAMQRAIFELQRPVSAEFLQAIFQLTDGNPYFIEEVLKSLVTAGDIFLRSGVWDRKPLQQLRIPRSIQVAVQQRVARLEDGCRHVMLLAAVVGRRFDFGLLQALTGMDEAPLLAHLKQLVAAQIIVEETAEQFAFRHALTREAVYSTLLQRERQPYHQAIAEILERRFQDRPDLHAAELAHHFYLARDWARVATFAQRAGDHAQAMFAPREATELYTRALEAAEHLGRPPSAELMRSRGQGYEILGEIERARADYERALLLAHQMPEPRVEWQCLVDLGFVWVAQDYAQAGGYFHRALNLARSMDDPALLAHSLNRLGNWHANIGQPRQARQYHLEALEHFENLGNQQGRAETLDLLGMTSTMSGDYFHGFAYYQQAVGLFEAIDDRRGLASSLSVMAECGSNYLLDAVSVAPITLTEAVSHGRRALDITRQIGWRSGEAYILVVLSLCAGSLGRHALALEQSQQALDIATELEHHQWMAYAHIARGLARASLLDFSAARPNFERAVALAKTINSQFWTGIAAALLASVLIEQNELEPATALLTTNDEGEPALPSLPARLIAVARLELAIARGAAATAEPEAARLLSAVMPTEQKHDPTWQAAPRLLLLYAEILTAQKQFGQATSRLQLALGAAQVQGARPLEWRVQAALGRCWRAQRRFDAAEAAFTLARALIETVADEIPDAELRLNFRQAALAQLPGRRPGSNRRATQREFGGLTKRERDIAVRVGQGHSNREIAAGLVLSERTVEKHVSNILGKLGLSTRGQIAAWAHRKGLESKALD